LENESWSAVNTAQPVSRSVAGASADEIQPHWSFKRCTNLASEASFLKRKFQPTEKSELTKRSRLAKIGISSVGALA
jgi:hypothetical protein